MMRMPGLSYCRLRASKRHSLSSSDDESSVSATACSCAETSTSFLEESSTSGGEVDVVDVNNPSRSLVSSGESVALLFLFSRRLAKGANDECDRRRRVGAGQARQPMPCKNSWRRTRS